MALATAFAPAERAPQQEVLRQHEKLAALPFVREFLDALPDMSLVLNAERQIVLANRAFAAFLDGKGAAEPPGRSCGEATAGLAADVLGRRPGEAIGCLRSRLTEAGCGTTPFCRTCGAVNAILNSTKLHTLDVQECRMIRGEAGSKETALDLRVWSRPIDVQGEVFTVFSVVDISNEKRREALERIFFHDVLNTAGGVKGLADLIVEAGVSGSGILEVAGMLAESADQLLEEINAQRMLSAAESGELQVDAQPTHSLELLHQMIRHFHSYCASKGKAIGVEASAEPFDLVSDPVLLRRVLTNLVKNALEAAETGGTVTLGCHAEGDSVCLTVHNAAVIPPEVQPQIFSRSFSTKGSGRGLGTYSIRLISERYLHGHVSFVSNAAEGTRFTVRFPRVIPSSGAGKTATG